MQCALCSFEFLPVKYVLARHRSQPVSTGCVNLSRVLTSMGQRNFAFRGPISFASRLSVCDNNIVRRVSWVCFVSFCLSLFLCSFFLCMLYVLCVCLWTSVVWNEWMNEWMNSVEQPAISSARQQPRGKHVRTPSESLPLRTMMSSIHRAPLWRFFTALHVMQTRYSEENSVCLSVCPSHAWSLTKRKKDLSRFLYHTKEHLS